MKSLPRGRHERLQVSELQARVAELEEELAGARTTELSDDRVVVGQPGLEDSRNAYADTLLRSERLKEMRALAEKVLGIGTVESRRASPVGAQECGQVAWFGKLTADENREVGKVKFAGIRPE